MYRGGGDTKGRTIEFQQISDVQVASGSIPPSTDVLFINSKAQISKYQNSADYVVDDSTLQETYFLPWQPDSATFMQLSDGQVEKWFFTSELSGCEIWIAHDRNGKPPFIIHLNLKNCENANQPEEMEKLGNEAVKRITETNTQYNLLIKRIVKQKRRQFTYPEGTAFYTKAALFYGRYTGENRCEDKSLYTGGWTFYLRDTEMTQFFDLGE